MKQSRNVMHRHTQLNMPPPRNNLASLKAIMNQGRVPLGQYINQRPNKHTPLQIHQMSYIDKMKAKLYNGSRQASLEKEMMNEGSQKMLSEEITDKLNEYLLEYEPSAKVSQRKDKSQVRYSKGKERSMSTYGAYRRVPSTYKKLPVNGYTNQICNEHLKNDKNTKERVQTQQISSIDSSNKPQNVFTKFGKQVKREKVDYNKFTSLLEEVDHIPVLQLEEVLGSGATATVRAAKDKHSRQYAVKIYEKYKLIEPKRLKRVMQEIRILGKLDHPNVIKLEYCFQDKRQIHLLFEYIQGAQTLHDHIRSKGYNLQTKEQLKIAVGITQAIVYLHSLGVSHRDIKTDNVIIGANGEVKVIDFGFATTLVKSESHCGTPNYMAPELFEKKNTYNPTKVDAWALAVLLFYLYQGSYPFKGYSEKQLTRNITSCNFTFTKCHGWTRSVIENALVADPVQRLSVEDMLNMLKS